ncbi:MAG: hypothetical protein R6X05_04630 [Desulfobacterales bacterium]
MLGVLAFRHFDLGQYLSLGYIKSSQERFHALYQSHRLLVIAAYMGICIAVTALSLPGAAVMTLAAGGHRPDTHRAGRHPGMGETRRAARHQQVDRSRRQHRVINL